MVRRKIKMNSYLGRNSSFLASSILKHITINPNMITNKSELISILLVEHLESGDSFRST